MKRLLYLYNPHSGGEVHTRRLDAILEAFTARGVACLPHRLYTRSPDDILDGLIKNAAGRFDAVAVAGGDGTAAAVINMLRDAGHKSLPVAVLPAGTCNDFARGLGMPADLVECAEIISRFNTVSVDLGTIKREGQPSGCFINSIAAGLFAGVSYGTPPELKKRFGALAYYVAALGELGAVKPFGFRVETERERLSGRALLVVVLNGSGVGGMNNVLPHADMRDGRMNILIARDCGGLEKASAFINLMAAKPDPNLLFLQCERCRLSADAPVNVSVDGEEGGSLPYVLAMERGAVNVIAPPSV